MLDPGLKNKVALVTGGNNPYGIGSSIARALSAGGAGVFIHYYRYKTGMDSEDANIASAEKPGMEFFLKQQQKDAGDTLKAISDNGGKAGSFECDLKDPDVIPELFDQAEETLGAVDILVNNAVEYQADSFMPESELQCQGNGLWEEGPSISRVGSDTFDRHFNVNTRAAVLLSAEFFKRYLKNRKKWGRIINISSDCASGCPFEISYRASKYALESYSRSAAAEMGPYGITVNVVSPGPIQTGYISNELEKDLIREIPMRRIGRPEDIADAVVFFASEQAKWITGQVLLVHGGHRMSLGR